MMMMMMISSPLRYHQYLSHPLLLCLLSPRLPLLRHGAGFHLGLKMRSERWNIMKQQIITTEKVDIDCLPKMNLHLYMVLLSGDYCSIFVKSSLWTQGSKKGVQKLTHFFFPDGRPATIMVSFSISVSSCLVIFQFESKTKHKLSYVPFS